MSAPLLLAPRILPSMQSDFKVPAGLSRLWQTTCEPENPKASASPSASASSRSLIPRRNFPSPVLRCLAIDRAMCVRFAQANSREFLKPTSRRRRSAAIRKSLESRRPTGTKGSKSPLRGEIARSDPNKPRAASTVGTGSSPADGGSLTKARGATAKRGGEFRGK
jgi:hypothetical protein